MREFWVYVAIVLYNFHISTNPSHENERGFAFLPKGKILGVIHAPSGT
jgi:hypothetical protein